MILAANKSPKEKGALANMYFTTVQIQEINKVAGDYAPTLMAMYVGIAQQTNPNMEDTQLAKMTGKSERAIKKIRLALTKAGWFRRIKTTVKGEVLITYLVGKSVVAQSSLAVVKPKALNKPISKLL